MPSAPFLYKGVRMFAKDREAMRLTPAEARLILIESLQWCANNAVYFLGLIGAAT